MFHYNATFLKTSTRTQLRAQQKFQTFTAPNLIHYLLHSKLAHSVSPHLHALLPSTLILPAWHLHALLYMHSTALQSTLLVGDASPVTLL
jgi:hypothetical protein